MLLLWFDTHPPTYSYSSLSFLEIKHQAFHRSIIDKWPPIHSFRTKTISIGWPKHPKTLPDSMVHAASWGRGYSPR